MYVGLEIVLYEFVGRYMSRGPFTIVHMGHERYKTKKIDNIGLLYFRKALALTFYHP